MIGTLIFVILALIAIASAVGMLTSTNAVRAALFLVVNFICVALFYLGLNAPFLAMVQVTVYAGAIMVLFLFVIMLLGAERVPLESKLRWQAPVTIILAVLLVAVAAFVLFSPQVGVDLSIPPLLSQSPSAMERYGGPQAVGEVLFTRYMLPMQMVGLLLLVAMIGAVVLTRDEQQKKRGRLDKQDIQK